MNEKGIRDRKAPARRFKPGTVRRLLSYMSEYRLRLAAVLMCILLSAASGASTSIFLRSLIDEIITPLLGQARPSYAALYRMLLLMAAVYAVGVLAALCYNRMMVTVGQGTLKRIRDTMFERMQSLPVKYFDTHTHGDVMSRYTNDTDPLRHVIAQGLPQMVNGFFTIVTTFITMLSLSVGLSVFVALFSLVLLKTIRFIVGRSSGYFIRQQEDIGDVNGYIEEIINGQKVVKVFCHEERAGRAFDEKNGRLCASATAANQYGIITMPVVSNMGFLLYVLLAVIGGAAGIAGLPNLSLAGVGVLSVGTIVSFLTLSRNFVNPMGQISSQFNMVVMALAGASRIFELMDEQPERDAGYVTLVSPEARSWAWKYPHRSDGSVTYAPLRGEIMLQGVDFAYEENKPVLHGITLTARPGQKIALVGATGAGKTTITNLINRFYDISAGEIRYDGILIEKIRKADLRHSLGVVLQDVNLFTGTVMENIRYGRLDATDEEVIQAAKTASAHSFIMRLADGYDTLLTGDGANLSQGQRQLLNIARAAISHAPILVLDEATSSVDTRTERHIEHGMERLMKNRTTFIIAHRLSTVRNSNAIMVLENGEIIERGDHDDLVKQKGKYYQLYTGAFELS